MKTKMKIESTIERISQRVDAIHPLREASNRDPNDWQILHVAPFGSMGDEALAAGTIAAARSLGQRCTIFVPGDADRWHLLGSESFRSLSGLMSPVTYARTRAARHSFGPRLAAIGADTLSGEYGVRYLGFRVRLLNEVARAGGSARVFNASFSTRPTRDALRLLSSLDDRVRVFARDKASAGRLAEAVRRDVETLPDVAVLMQSVAPASPLPVGPRAVLVPNAHLATHFGRDRRDLTRLWADVASSLATEYEILVMPHDTRDVPDDPGLCAAIVDELAHRNVRSTYYTPRSAMEAKGVLAEAAIVISARMHACIAALSSGVPTVGLEYLGKFQGQFQWYGDGGVVLPEAQAQHAEEIVGAASVLAGEGPSREAIERVAYRAARVLGEETSDGR